MSQVSIIDIEGTHPQIPTQFDANIGFAIPIANTLEILGDTVANATNAIPVSTTGSGNTVTVEVQVGAAITGAPADNNDAGLVSFDDTMFTVDANGFVQLAGGGVGIDSLTGDDGVSVGGDASGNINLVGSVVANATNPKPLYVDGDAGTFTQSLELQVASAIAAAPGDTNDAGIASFDDTYFTVNANGYVSQTTAAIDTAMANFIVDPNGTRAEYTTITAALAAASAGDTIGIKPGTYTENLTLKAGVNLTTFSGEENDGQVEIVGKLSASFSGSASISGLRLTTNADYSIEMTGANATKLYVQGCDFNGADATSINVTNSSASSLLFIDNCTYTPSSGNTFITWSGAGVFRARYSFFADTAGAVTSTFSSGNIFFKFCESNIPFTFSSSASLSAFSCNFNTQGLNLTPIVSNSTSATRTIQNSSLNGGTASAISIGAASSLSLFTCNIFSSNTSAIANSGTLTYSGLSFTGSSSAIVGGTQTLVNEGPSRTIGSSNVGGSNVLTTINTDNTNASSDAAIIASIGGTSAGEAYFSASKGSTVTWSQGLKAGAGTSYFFSTAAASSTTPDSGTQIVAININGSTTISGQADGSTTNMLMENVNNTAGSSVNLALRSAGSTAGDAWIRFQISGSGEYSLGVDNSDSDALCLTSTSTLNGTNRLRMTSVGEMTLPFQPAFLAANGTSDTNVTGAGTAYKVEFNTEYFDQNGDYDNTTDTFTAPVTGKYHFDVIVSVASLTSLMTLGRLELVASNRTARLDQSDFFAQSSSNAYQTIGSILMDMDAADTAFVQLTVSNGAGDTASVIGGSNSTLFSGYLAC